MITVSSGPSQDYPPLHVISGHHGFVKILGEINGDVEGAHGLIDSCRLVDFF